MRYTLRWEQPIGWWILRDYTGRFIAGCSRSKRVFEVLREELARR